MSKISESQARMLGVHSGGSSERKLVREAKHSSHMPKRSRHSDGGETMNAMEKRKGGHTKRSCHAEGGMAKTKEEDREKRGMGGMIAGQLAGPLLDKIPHIGGMLSGLAKTFGSFLPFATGGDVESHKGGKRCGKKRTKRMGGGPLEQGIEDAIMQNSKMPPQRMVRKFMPQQPLGRPKTNLLYRKPLDGLMPIGRPMPRGSEMMALAEGGDTDRKMKAAGGVGKLRKGQYN